MLVPSIFNDSFFDGFPFFDNRAIQPKKAPAPRISRMANVMKTDVKEVEGGYEVKVDLPGFKKEDSQNTSVDFEIK